MATNISARQRIFIEQFAALNRTIGVPKSTMRILAYLIICDEPEQTTKDIMNSLDLSPGSVSAGLTVLIEAGILERVKRPGVRLSSYRVHPEGWDRAVAQRIKSIHTMAVFADESLGVYPQNQRIAAMRNTYVQFDEHLKTLSVKKEHANG